MKRRNFIKISGIGAIGLPLSRLNSNFSPAPNPFIAVFIEEFAIALFGRDAAKQAAMAFIGWAVPKALDWMFGDGNDDCCGRTIRYLDSQGYYPYKNNHNTNVIYAPPKPIQQAMPSTISEYGAFSFAKKNPIFGDENTQTVFLAKTHESKEIAAAIPESVMVACILAAKQMVEKEGLNYDEVQKRLLPIALLSEKISIEEAFTVKMYKTAYGSFTLSGDGNIIERDSHNIPTSINGTLVVTSSKTTDGLVMEEPYDLSKKKLDFLYDSLKLAKG